MLLESKKRRGNNERWWLFIEQLSRMIRITDRSLDYENENFCYCRFYHSIYVFRFFGERQSSAQTVVQKAPYRVGQWLPLDQQFLNEWIADLISETEKSGGSLLPVIQEFKLLIESDPDIYMLFSQMFQQVPKKAPFNQDPTGKPQIRDYRQMLRLMNRIMTKAPEFNKTGLVGFPINAILDWPMGTQAGTAAFLNDKVNRQLKKILNEWAVFLKSADSRYVLGDDPKSGWFGRDAREAMPDFARDFQCNPDLPYYGFKSWDDFLTRVFREGRRPWRVRTTTPLLPMRVNPHLTE